MGSEKKIHVSQCMIVKNEERNIERALSWGKDIMWEQIVVDTGSTDRTAELAARMGAKVFSFPWTEDFAAAKNHALEKAEGDWIAFLDADEYMMPEDVHKLELFLEGPDGQRYDGISMTIMQLEEEGNLIPSGNQIRFFRNLPDIRYRRRIHEQLVSGTGRALRIGDGGGEWSVIHTGYQKKILEEKKGSGRNLRLLRRELEDHPDDHEMLGYMGDEYFADDDRQEAEKWYRKAILQMPPILQENDQRSAVTYTNLLLILTEAAHPPADEIGGIYRKAVAHLPEEADFDYIMGRYHAAADRMGQAASHLEAALEKLDRFGHYNKAFRLVMNLMDAYELLMRCYYEMGDGEKCVAYGTVCLRSDKYVLSALSCLLRLLAPDDLWSTGREEDRDRILGFFLGFYDPASLKDRLLLITTAGKVGCRGFSEYAKERLLSPEEKALLRRI